MKIIPLSEGSFSVDASKAFTPFNLQEDAIQERSRGSLLVEVQPFVVVTDHDIILLDTGLGFSKDGMMQLHHNLIENGINPLQVTKVLMSHLHKDHSGGLMQKDATSGMLFAAFPDATHYIAEDEYNTAIQSTGSSYIKDDVATLPDVAKVVFLDEQGKIGDNIIYERSGGHSPYHTVFTIEENGDKVFFGGDEAPQLQQMKSRFIAKYDADGKKAMELRQKWWEEAKGTGTKFLFYHDTTTPVATP